MTLSFVNSYHIPDVHIKTCEPLRAGEESNLIIKVVNPTPYQTTVTLLPLKEEIPAVEEEEPVEESSSVISKYLFFHFMCSTSHVHRFNFFFFFKRTCAIVI